MKNRFHCLTFLVFLAASTFFCNFSLAQVQPNLAISTPKVQASTINLTQEEIAWLKAHPQITVAVKHGYSPIEYVFELQKFRGISLDYLKEFESMLDVTFDKTIADPNINNIDADVISSVTSLSSLDGSKFTALNAPYLTSPIVAFTKKGAPKFDGMQDLYGKKVAVFKSSFIAKRLAEDHPLIDLFMVDIAEEAIDAVVAGKVDAYIGNETIVKYVLKSAENEALELNMNTPYNSEIYMAVRSDWPLLKSILEKTLLAIPQQHKTEILNKWTSVPDSKKINHELIGSILAVSLVILSIFYVSNRRLKNEVRQRGLLEDSLIKAKVDAEYAEQTIRQYSKDLERLAMVAKHTSDAVIITDSEGKTIWVNQAFTKLTGYSYEEMLGKKPGKLLQGIDTSPEAIVQLHNAVSGFSDIEIELINYKKSGEPYWVNIKIVAIVNSFGERRFISIQTDITRQVNYIKTIKNNQEDMDALFSLSPDGVVVLDGDGLVSHVNAGFTAMTGFDTSLILGSDEDNLDGMLRRLCIDPGAYKSVAEYRQMTVRSDKKFVDTEDYTKYDFKFEIGTPKQRILERSCIESNQKRISRVIYFKDVTQKVILENMKSEFITTAAHELRTPMSVILGYAELLKMRAFKADMQVEMIDAIYNKSSMVASLLDDLLDVAVIEYRAEKTLKLEKHAFEPFIQNITETFIFSGNPNRVLLSELPAIPDFYFDAQRFERAINNCLTNAYKFSSSTSEVKMHVHVTQSHTPELVIEILDQGVGMNPEQLSRIFEKFYRADKSGHIPGTGLGMVLVKDIMEAHGGRVVVESTPNVGTKVSLMLPIRTML